MRPTPVPVPVPVPVIQSLVAAHRNMERVLTLMRFQVDALQAEGDGDSAELTLLGNAIVYMRNYPGVNHHPTEDLIFRKLIGHAPENRVSCMQISEQHQDFGRRESSLLHHIRAAQGGDQNARRHVKDMGVAYCLEHSSHIRSEETELFPQAVRWLSEPDWRDIANRSKAMTHPDFESKELKRYDNLYDRLMSLGGVADAGGSETA